MTDEPLSLSALNEAIKEALAIQFVENVWVVAEIASLKRANNGHCYMEWVEKQKDRVIAKSRAVCWSYTYQSLSANFFKVTGAPIQEGMKVLFCVEIVFHEVYGLSFQIKGIDATYTLGEMARRRQEILKRLEREGLLALNKHKELPLVIQKIAVISSDTAAGYEDFMVQMENNGYGIQFNYTMFNAAMQGEKTSSEVVDAFNRIEEGKFDVVVLIRGGGSTIDLNSFDDYPIAKAIANCSFPVFVGIGHERDETLPDFVANKKLKTPTAVAEYIIEHNGAFIGTLEGLQSALKKEVEQKVAMEKQALSNLKSSFLKAISNTIKNNKQSLLERQKLLNNASRFQLYKQGEILKRIPEKLKEEVKFKKNSSSQQLSFIQNRIIHAIPNLLKDKHQKLDLVRTKVKLNDPVRLLEKGYSLVYKDNVLIKSKLDVNKGDELQVKLKNDNIKVEVK